MNFEQYDRELGEHLESYTTFIEDIKGKLTNLMESDAMGLQQMLDNYEQEENNLKNLCKVTANETVELRGVLKRAEAIRNGWEAVKRRLQNRKTRISQHTTEFKTVASKILQKSNDMQHQLQNDNELNESSPPISIDNKRLINGVQLEFHDTTNTLTITIKGRQFNLIHDKNKEKWVTPETQNYSLNRILGEFNLHGDVVQLIASLRYSVAQGV